MKKPMVWGLSVWLIWVLHVGFRGVRLCISEVWRMDRWTSNAWKSQGKFLYSNHSNNFMGNSGQTIHDLSRSNPPKKIKTQNSKGFPSLNGPRSDGWKPWPTHFHGRNSITHDLPVPHRERCKSYWRYIHQSLVITDLRDVFLRSSTIAVAFPVEFEAGIPRTASCLLGSQLIFNAKKVGFKDIQVIFWTSNRCHRVTCFELSSTIGSPLKVLQAIVFLAR